MRAKDIKIRLEIPLPVDKPDDNGVYYDTACWENLVEKHLECLPIVYTGKKETMLLGQTTGATITPESLIIDGVIHHGGTNESVDVNIDRENGRVIVTNMSIECIGFSQ